MHDRLELNDVESQGCSVAVFLGFGSLKVVAVAVAMGIGKDSAESPIMSRTEISTTMDIILILNVFIE